MGLSGILLKTRVILRTAPCSREMSVVDGTERRGHAQLETQEMPLYANRRLAHCAA